MPRSEFAALLDLATDLARAAGRLALEGRRSAPSAMSTVDPKSSPTDLVTEFDRAAEQLIVERILATRPDDSILGEEGTDVAGSSGYVWAIDPIDGTTNYVYDLPAWSTSVAVSAGDRTIAGAVYVPALDEMYAAAAGAGATLNGQPIRCSNRSELSLALVATGFGYRPEVRARQAARVASMIPSIRDIRRLGSAAIDLCQVATGRVDAYFEEHLNPWDAAAGELIAREAGARSSDFAGSDPRPDELLVAAPGVHGALIDLIRSINAP